MRLISLQDLVNKWMLPSVHYPGKAVLMLIFLSLAPLSYPQAYTSRNIGIREGLPDGTIHDMIIDSRGFYWIATSGGLVRWFGDRIELYGAEKGLPTLNVRSVTEDGNGNLWLGLTGHGIGRYNGKDFEMKVPWDSVPGDWINRVRYIQEFGITMAACSEGFIVISDNRYIVFRDYGNVQNFFPSGPFIYVQSYTMGNFRYYPGDGNVIADFPDDNRPPNTIGGWITSSKDTLWALRRMDIFISGENNRGRISGIAEVLGFAEDKDGNILIAARESPFSELGGLFRLSGNRTESMSEMYGISAGRLVAVIYDPSDNVIVIADADEGLFVLYPPLIKNEHKGITGLPHLNIRSFAADDSGRLWVLHEKGIYTKEKDHEQFEAYDIDILEKEFRKFMEREFPVKYFFYNDPEGSYEKYDHLQRSGKYPYPNPYSRYQDGEMIIFENGLLFSPGEYEYLKNQRIDNYKYIAGGQGNSVWVLTNVGLFHLSENKTARYTDYFSTALEKLEVMSPEMLLLYLPDRIVFLPVTEKMAPARNISLSGITAHFTDMVRAGSNIWIACRNRGLYLLRGEKLRHFTHTSPGRDPSITSLTADETGNIIAGTGSGDLHILRYEHDSIGVIFTLDREDGITGNQVTWLETDHNGNLWAGTNAGMNIIDLNKLYETGIPEIRFMDMEDGCCQPVGASSVTGPDGNIWIGGRGNLSMADTKAAIRLLPGPRQVHIRQATLDYQLTDWSGFAPADRWTGMPLSGIRLKHYQNNLGFYFSTAQIAGSGKTLFRYRVVGFNDDWSPFEKSDMVLFPNLPYGRYRLQVEAQLAFYEKSRGGTEFYFRILPPWWERWWFYSVSGILLMSLLWAAMVLRVRHVRTSEIKKYETEREISELRIRALQAQMNPHFTFNAINSIQYFLFSRDKDAAFRYIGHFSRLIRQTLEFASQSSVSIKEEIEFTENYIQLEQIRFENRFSYKIKTEQKLDSHMYRVPPMLLQPFVENSIIHGLIHKDEPGMLKITLSTEGPGILKYTIEDDGIGREKSAEINRGRHKNHRSVGLDISGRRIRLMNRPGQAEYRIEITDLHDNRNRPCGTKVALFIPLEISDITPEKGEGEW